MRLEQLEYLLEISKTRSISLASQNLHISHQSLSKAIQNLEKELEIPIVERSSKGISLTTQGQQVIEIAQRVFSELNALHELKSQLPFSQATTGTLTIMFCNTFDINRITTSINVFSAAYPKAQVNLIKDSLPYLLNSIYEKTADIGLISLPDTYPLSRLLEAEKFKDLAFHPMLEDKLLVAVSKVSPLASRQSISLPTLLKYPLILLKNNEEPEQENWLYALLAQYEKPNIIVKTNSVQMYLKSIADNTGVGFFTNTAKHSLYQGGIENIAFIPVRPVVRMSYSYVTNRTTPMTPLMQAYLPYLIK